jgi:hypothetical protein
LESNWNETGWEKTEFMVAYAKSLKNKSASLTRSTDTDNVSMYWLKSKNLTCSNICYNNSLTCVINDDDDAYLFCQIFLFFIIDNGSHFSLILFSPVEVFIEGLTWWVVGWILKNVLRGKGVGIRWEELLILIQRFVIERDGVFQRKLMPSTLLNYLLHAG